MTVQICKISDESINHVSPMGEHVHIFSAWAWIFPSTQCSSSLCQRLHLNASWMLNEFHIFGGEKDFRGLEKEMECFEEVSIFHCFDRGAGYRPSRFFVLLIKGQINSYFIQSSAETAFS